MLLSLLALFAVLFLMIAVCSNSDTKKSEEESSTIEQTTTNSDEETKVLNNRVLECQHFVGHLRLQNNTLGHSQLWMPFLTDNYIISYYPF